MSDHKLGANPVVVDADHLRAILDAAEVVVYSKDLDGRYTWANRLGTAVTGLTVEETLGQTDFDLLPRALAERFQQIDEQVIVGHTDRLTVETTVRMADGTERIFENITKPLTDGHGNRVGIVGSASDITERKALEHDLSLQRRLLQTVLDHVDAAIYMLDQSDRYQYVNQACADFYGLSPDEIIGKSVIELLGAEVAEQLAVTSRQVFETGQVQRVEEEVIDGSGARRYFWSIKVPFDPDGEEQRMLIGISTEITPLHEAQEQLRRLSLTDPLTDLSNRRDFEDQVEREFSRARRRKTPTALLLMDLDWFKSINDRFGHPTGDDVLVKVAHLINGVTRAEDVAARLGGEEFALLMPGTDRNEALAVAERLRTRIAEAQHGGAELDTFTVTISIGVAVCASGQTSTKDFYRLADEALMRAKTKGRNRVEAWDQ
ncbi:sensor domain-containing diguanylate cyclase [Wenzhouxiangella limi]|uniref:Sensor domain-containing diguanylate cyclase n=1 Tax=Wenzhouxiangella limi TaxID=2707351 RepID=A0A845V235_9GAMM|nr:sensor domain-containing diguanylate cyclase [Wenzhouxiangella limi]NDY96774.1 sensor domain-containing diguanylate cyclase [Wenzhouxiangella limi]